MGIRRDRAWPTGDEAVSGLFALLIATTFVAVSFGSLTYVTINAAPTEEEAEALGVELNADLLALDLVELPGGVLDLTDGPTVDPIVLDQLQDASETPVDDDVTDYEEAVEGLGYDFHLRLWPILPDAFETLAAGGDPTLFVLYIAHHESTGHGPNADSTPTEEAKREIAFLDALLAHFDPATDVVADDDAAAPLRSRLGEADALVIGSHADLSGLNAVQNLLRSWVSEGGALIVLGTDGEDALVRQLMDRTRTGAHHALSDPDEDHPALYSPNRLDADLIPAAEAAGTHGGGADPFARVLGNGDLLVSDPGAHGQGRILVTAWTPGADDASSCDASAPTAECAGLQALHNLLSFGYTDLYLDYGPPAPEQGRVDTARRTVAIDHPRWGHVDLALLVLTY